MLTALPAWIVTVTTSDGRLGARRDGGAASDEDTKAESVDAAMKAGSVFLAAQRAPGRKDAKRCNK